jgi:hypothetical protein
MNEPTGADTGEGVMAAPVPTVLDLTVMALAETNPRAAATVEAAGANRAGHPSLGLLGWLPMPVLREVCRAAILAHRRAGTEFWADDLDEMVRDLARGGLWCTPRAHLEPWASRIDAAGDAWMAEASARMVEA